MNKPKPHPNEPDKSAPDELIIKHNPEKRSFDLLDGEKTIGTAEYKDIAGDRRIFHHTVVDEEYGGRGLAGRMMTEALDATVAAGMKIVPVCAYVAKFVQKHSEYADNVVAPTAETMHLLG